MTVHSIDGKSWLTKLERIGVLAEKEEIVFNNLGHCIDEYLLWDIYREMDEKKAVGIDGVGKAEYGRDLHRKLENVIKRIRRGSYKPKASRMVEIPKEDGTKRPLAISCFEDKLVQNAVKKVLEAIYEERFLPCSYGYRPNKSCHEALRALKKYTYEMKDGAVVEIDIKKYFNTIPHKALKEFLKMRISDRKFLRLLDVLIKAPTIENGVEKTNEIGCPQGSIISPIMANVYLHYVIDMWFNVAIRGYMRGRVEMVRYADDMVFVFEKKEEAESFFKVLPKRLRKYGLEMHMDKSQLIESGSKRASLAAREGRRLGVYKFLGFICYWGKARKGFWRLKLKSRGDRMRSKLKDIREHLWKNLNARNTNRVLEKVIQKVRGWMNYHGISDNHKKVNGFLQATRRILFRWFNRRGKKRAMIWTRFNQVMKALNFPITWHVISMF